ncbi:MAG: hypothetical protein LBG93_04360 [Treponema sp.]|jgi:osmoprotectant transport system permease protein|nr:hypothetical protein [Treponema sp.]
MKQKIKRILVLFLSSLVLFAAVSAFSGCARRADVVIAAKNYTEQFILGYVLQILIEENTELSTQLVSNLPSWILFQSFLSGESDVSIEYTGTITQIYFADTTPRPPEEVFSLARSLLAEHHDIILMDRIGFNNTYTLSVRRDTAEQFNLRTISDLAAVSRQLTLGATMEFLNREDGLLGMREVYNLYFGTEIVVDGVLRYQALMNDEVQVIDAFSTEGMLRAHDLVVLEDDREFFPAYHAAVMIRGETLRRFPQLEAVLNSLVGTLDEYRMSELNYRVEALHENPQNVARSFLAELGLIP